MFLRHVDLLGRLRPGAKLLHEVRKASAWYVKGLHGGSALRSRVWNLVRPEDVVSSVLEHIDQLTARSSTPVVTVPAATASAQALRAAPRVPPGVEPNGLLAGPP